MKNAKEIIGRKFALDLGSSAPVEVKVIDIIDGNVIVEYLNSTPGRSGKFSILDFENFSGNKIAVAVYGKQYSENKLTEMIMNKDFGFEFSIENETERSRRIFSFEEIMELKKSIETALKDYENYSL